MSDHDDLTLHPGGLKRDVDRAYERVSESELEAARRKMYAAWHEYTNARREFESLDRSMQDAFRNYASGK